MSLKVTAQLKINQVILTEDLVLSALRVEYYIENVMLVKKGKQCHFSKAPNRQKSDSKRKKNV